MKNYPPTDAFRRAVVIREQMDKLTAELDSLMGSMGAEGEQVKPVARAKMSPETRAKIAAKQKENWEKRNAAMAAATPAKGAGKKTKVIA